MFTAHKRAMFAAHLRDSLPRMRDTYGYLTRGQLYRQFDFLRNAEIHDAPASVIAATLETLPKGPMDIGVADVNDLYRIYAEHEVENLFPVFTYLLTGMEAHACENCGDAVWEYLNYVQDLSASVCSNCLSDYNYCERCGEYTSSDMTYTADGDVCESCLDNYTYCETCDRYNRVDDPCDCSENCDCEAEHKHFTFPANGDGTIANDERLHVTLPTGEIPERGIIQIIDLIYKELQYVNDTEITEHVESVFGYRTPYSQRRSTYNLYYRYPREHRLHYGVLDDVMTTVGAEWQTRQGNFTRRLSSTLYKAYGLKLPKTIVTEIGNIAKQQMGKATEFDIEFTRNLNLSATDFYHEDSCWWQSYAYSRCCLKSWGGLGMRTFDGNDVTGRAWIQPLDSALMPTHDIDNAKAFIVYNGYGDLEGYAPARILSHLTGLTYKKIRYSAPNSQYINSEQGYLISSADVLADTSEIRFDYDYHKRF